MFITSLKNQEENDVSVIGQFKGIDGSHFILETADSVVKVEPQGLDSYRTKYIMVSGTVQDGVLIEKSAQAVEDDFNYALYTQLASVNANFPDMF